MRRLGARRRRARTDPGFVGGNEAELLRGGDQLFPRMLEAIQRAHAEVWLATYIFHSDAASLALADALVAADRRGVRVRVVVDGFGSKGSLPVLRQRLAGSGVALAVFRPMDRWWHWFQPGQLRRLHQKLCVVDGATAFVGGVNIIDDRLDIHHGFSESPRLDFSVQLRGPLVAAVAQGLRSIWSRAWLGRDFDDALLDYIPLRRRLRRWLAQLWRGPQRLPQAVPRLPPVCAAFVMRDNLRRRRTIEHAYVDAIRGARASVDLICPYFYPGQRIRLALRRAADRGVRVRLLLQGKLDYRLAGWAAEALYAELIGHGVEIYEYTPAFLHAKVAVVDGQWATVGSSNIDPLSLLLNLEANVVLRDGGFARHLADEIETALAVSARVGERGGTGLRAMLHRAAVAWFAYVFLRVAGAAGRY
ncbi:cardiolipin synthase ClsB [Roseateles saccharophilus]|uniref:Cardiolipin synthase B n=1 Tax=Roseateles saccharophilus TaxID=304 RepID=A0A4R3UPX6_ROSSA|nr:cardiolipin synthase ClsB [Roseateles saccharophilus]MDG0833398.1 cardiolipin synthase ClsB [Roseateles saccharophilus]TCU93052.1 cardiolipin synthase [Roseateles saccharophilus]